MVVVRVKLDKVPEKKVPQSQGGNNECIFSFMRNLRHKLYGKCN